MTNEQAIDSFDKYLNFMYRTIIEDYDENNSLKNRINEMIRLVQLERNKLRLFQYLLHTGKNSFTRIEIFDTYKKRIDINWKNWIATDDLPDYENYMKLVAGLKYHHIFASDWLSSTIEFATSEKLGRFELLEIVVKGLKGLGVPEHLIQRFLNFNPDDLKYVEKTYKDFPINWLKPSKMCRYYFDPNTDHTRFYIHQRM